MTDIKAKEAFLKNSDNRKKQRLKVKEKLLEELQKIEDNYKERHFLIFILFCITEKGKKNINFTLQCALVRILLFCTKKALISLCTFYF